MLDKVTPIAERRWQVEAAPNVMVRIRSAARDAALLELPTNAIRFTEPGDVIALGAPVTRTKSDYGSATRAPGSRRRSEHDFERFARGREGLSADRDDSGSGLGLSIVSAIAEAHHGRVLLESTLGRGSTFTLVMPQQARRSSDPRMTQQELVGSHPDCRGSSRG